MHRQIKGKSSDDQRDWTASRCSLSTWRAVRDRQLLGGPLRKRIPYFFMPDSRWLFLYKARSASLTCPIMSGLADPALAVAAAAGAFGFALFFAKAPDVETAKIARLTTNNFFMLKLP